MAYVYRHIRLDTNQPFYIGIGSDVSGNYTRAHYKDRSNFWKNIVQKTKYRIEIMLDELTWDAACLKECELIKLYGRSDLNEGTLVNLTNGGDGTFGYKHTNETKNKLRVPKNPISESKRIETRKHGVYAHSTQTKEKISRALLGKKKTLESQIKRVATWKANGNVPWNKDKLTISTRVDYLHSEQTKEKMKKPKKKITCPKCNQQGTVKKMLQNHFKNCHNIITKLI